MALYLGITLGNLDKTFHLCLGSKAETCLLKDRHDNRIVFLSFAK